MVTSVTEGEDKPLKYPLMFRACELVVVNKIDLLPHLDFDLDRFLANLDAVNPGVERLLVSATHRRGRRRVASLARRACRTARQGAGVRRPMTRRRRRGRARRIDELAAARTEANARFFEAEAERARAAAATGWPSGSRAAAAWSRSGARPRRAPTPATSPWSSSIR